MRDASGVEDSPNPTINVRFRNECGEEYDAELEVRQPIALVNGESVEAVELEPGDEIVSHHHNETGGTGHIVVGILD